VPVASLSVEFVNAARAPIAAAHVRSVLRRACKVPEIAARLPEQPATLAVRLTADAELRRLHRDYSGDDSVTDVLSFMGTEGHLGDLAISWPAVVRQAREYRHPAATELALLCVHGLLHLLGWDHATPAEHHEMSRVTVAALALSGLKISPRRL
jgi:probable rRNA maturation factor